ncbi:MAG: LuxR C-terminal-related transcriptional regulator [Xenococcaceae cyanobacterium]
MTQDQKRQYFLSAKAWLYQDTLKLVSKYTKEKILMASSKFKTPASLSERELQIIELIANGLTNLEIAQKLEISKRTVDNHISNILTKTKTENRVALVRWALHWGKVCLNDVNCCTLPLPSHQKSAGEAVY